MLKRVLQYYVHCHIASICASSTSCSSILQKCNLVCTFLSHSMKNQLANLCNKLSHSHWKHINLCIMNNLRVLHLYSEKCLLMPFGLCECVLSVSYNMRERPFGPWQVVLYSTYRWSPVTISSFVFYFSLKIENCYLVILCLSWLILIVHLTVLKGKRSAYT